MAIDSSMNAFAANSDNYLLRIEKKGNREIIKAEKKGVVTWLMANIFDRNSYKLENVVNCLNKKTILVNKKIEESVNNVINKYNEKHSLQDTFKALWLHNEGKKFIDSFVSMHTFTTVACQKNNPLPIEELVKIIKQRYGRDADDHSIEDYAQQVFIQNIANMSLTAFQEHERTHSNQCSKKEYTAQTMKGIFESFFSIETTENKDLHDKMETALIKAFQQEEMDEFISQEIKNYLCLLREEAFLENLLNDLKDKFPLMAFDRSEIIDHILYHYVSNLLKININEYIQTNSSPLKEEVTQKFKEAIQHDFNQLDLSDELIDVVSNQAFWAIENVFLAHEKNSSEKTKASTQQDSYKDSPDKTETDFFDLIKWLLSSR